MPVRPLPPPKKNNINIVYYKITCSAFCMKRVNDIFYSLQGEGYHTGRPALFVRFAGCNLRCPFCDTEFDSYHEWSEDYIVTELLAHCIDHCVLNEKPMVVLTGGEPTLQADDAFVDLLHSEGFYVAMESNGLLPAPANLDWLTVSPKVNRLRSRRKEAATAPLKSPQKRPDEIKIVFDGTKDPADILSRYMARTALSPGEAVGIRLYLQPCDTGNALHNNLITAACVEYIKHHPQWRLSLQTHKLIGIE